MTIIPSMILPILYFGYLTLYQGGGGEQGRPLFLANVHILMGVFIAGVLFTISVFHIFHTNIVNNSIFRALQSTRLQCQDKEEMQVQEHKISESSWSNWWHIRPDETTRWGKNIYLDNFSIIFRFLHSEGMSQMYNLWDYHFRNVTFSMFEYCLYIALFIMALFIDGYKIAYLLAVFAFGFSVIQLSVCFIIGNSFYVALTKSKEEHDSIYSCTVQTSFMMTYFHFLYSPADIPKYFPKERIYSLFYLLEPFQHLLSEFTKLIFVNNDASFLNKIQKLTPSTIYEFSSILLAKNEKLWSVYSTKPLYSKKYFSLFAIEWTHFYFSQVDFIRYIGSITTSIVSMMSISIIYESRPQDSYILSAWFIMSSILFIIREMCGVQIGMHILQYTDDLKYPSSTIWSNPALTRFFTSQGLYKDRANVVATHLVQQSFATLCDVANSILFGAYLIWYIAVFYGAANVDVMSFQIMMIPLLCHVLFFIFVEILLKKNIHLIQNYKFLQNWIQYQIKLRLSEDQRPFLEYCFLPKVDYKFHS